MKQLAALVAAGVLAGCFGSPPDDGEDAAPTGEVYFTKDFRVYTTRGREMAPWLQHQYDVLSRRFHFALPAGKVIRFNEEGVSYDHGDCPDPYCHAPDGFGISCFGWDSTERDCAVSLGTLYADLIGQGPELLRQGLGDVLAGGATFDEQGVPSPDRSIDLVPLFDDLKFSEVGAELLVQPTAASQEARVLRATAADLTRYLLDRLGPEGFARFYATWDRSEAGWVNSFGEGLSSTLAAWLATPSYAGRRYTWNEPECMSAALQAQGPGRWGASMDDVPYATINLAGDLAAYLPHLGAFALHLPEAGTVRVSVRGSSPTLLSVESCAGPTGPAPLVTMPVHGVPATGPFAGSQTLTLAGKDRSIGGWLPAGDYVVYGMAVWTPGEPNQISLTVEVDESGYVAWPHERSLH
jgi:hypothetical protein